MRSTIRLWSATALLFSGLASANIITVTTTSDDYGSTPATCSLREALRAAQTGAAFDGCAAGGGLLGDVVEIPSGVYLLTRPPEANQFAGGPLFVNAQIVELVSSGSARPLIRRDAGHEIAASAATLRLTHVNFGPGEAVLASDTALHLESLALFDARIDVVGTRPVTVRDVTIQGAQASLTFEGPTDVEGFAATDARAAPVCALEVGPGSHIRDATIRQRSRSSGEGCAIRLRNSDAATPSTIERVTILGPARGSGLLVGHAAVVRNLTVSGARGDAPAISVFQDGQGRQRPLRLENVTLAGNRSEHALGAAIVLHGTGDATRALQIANSIVTDNRGDSGALDITCVDGYGIPRIDTRGHNLFGSIDPDCALVGDTGEDRYGPATGLLPLFDSGGEVLTHALLPDSPARGFGDPAGPDGCAVEDARGYARLPSGCSAGAWEARDDFVVDTTLDLPDANPADLLCATSGPQPRCSLRAALQTAANFDQPITISLGDGATYRLSLAGPGEDLGATGDLDVRGTGVLLLGHGPDRTRIEVIGANRDRGFEQFAAQFALAGVRVSGGRASSGAGILLRMPYEPEARFLAYDVRFDDNVATSNGHAISHPTLDAVAASGRVALERVGVVDNGDGSGSAIYSGGHLSLLNSLVARNLGDAPAIRQSPAVPNGSSLTLQYATVVDNVGGGVSMTPVALHAAVLADNVDGGGQPANCVGSPRLEQGSYVWLGNASGCTNVTLDDPTNVVGAPAPLAPATEAAGHIVMLPLEGLADAIPAADCLQADGVPMREDLVQAARLTRPACDIGALDVALPDGLFANGFE